MREDEADAQDMDERAELTDHREAWPEEPELVEETEMRGRWWRYDIEGEMKVAASDLTMLAAGATRATCAGGPPGMEAGACGSTAAAAQALDTSSAKDEGSVLMMAMDGGAPFPGEAEVPMVPELETAAGEVAADDAEREATGEPWTAEAAGGGAICI